MFAIYLFPVVYLVAKPLSLSESGHGTNLIIVIQ